MGTLRGDNGGGPPPNGGGLPGLPPEWGTIIIPDDPAELARDASRVRRELRRQARADRWRRRLHVPSRTRRPIHDSGSSLGLPLLIMAIAIVATLTSLFALAWPGPKGHVSASPPQPAGTGTGSAQLIPDLALTASDGSQVHLRRAGTGHRRGVPAGRHRPRRRPDRPVAAERPADGPADPLARRSGLPATHHVRRAAAGQRGDRDPGQEHRRGDPDRKAREQGGGLLRRPGQTRLTFRGHERPNRAA